MSASRRSIPAPFAALVLALILWGPEARGIGIISVDEGEPGYSREGGRKRGKKEAPSGGDIQVGPAVNEGKRRRNRMPAAEPVADDSAAPSAEATETAEVPPPKGLIGSRVPGIFPVYEADKRWMLVERVPAGGKRIVKQDTQLVVIGSKGAAQFHAATSTQSYLPACRDAKPAKTLAFLLSAKSPKNFQQVGTPIIAIAMKPGASFDSSRAVFYALRNEVKEEVYQKLSGLPDQAGGLAGTRVRTVAGPQEDPDEDRLRLQATPPRFRRRFRPDRRSAAVQVIPPLSTPLRGGPASRLLRRDAP